MKIVVTGATSFIGSSVVRELATDRKNMIYAVIRPGSVNRKKIPNVDNVKVIELDMLRLDELHNCIEEQIDVVYHFAWEGVRMPQRDDSMIQEQNFVAAQKIVAECRLLGCKRFIGIGSQAEYGQMSGIITEEHECNPTCEYGRKKNAARIYLEEYGKEHQMEYIWTRIFSVYGPDDYEGSLIMSCINKMLKNENIPLTECLQEWDYLHIDDIAKLFAMLSDAECKSGVYNVASGIHKPLKDYVEIMKEVIHSESELQYGKVPFGEQGMVSFMPSVEKIRKETGWKPLVTFEEGVRTMIQGADR